MFLFFPSITYQFIFFKVVDDWTFTQRSKMFIFFKYNKLIYHKEF